MIASSTDVPGAIHWVVASMLRATHISTQAMTLTKIRILFFRMILASFWSAFKRLLVLIKVAGALWKLGTCKIKIPWNPKTQWKSFQKQNSFQNQTFKCAKNTFWSSDSDVTLIHHIYVRFSYSHTPAFVRATYFLFKPTNDQTKVS